MPRDRKPRVAAESAVGQVYGFMMAGIVFLAALSGIFAFTQGAGSDPAPAEHAALSLDADSLAAILLDDAGTGWASPDSLSRLGLANATGGGLSSAHIALLNNQSLAAQANGRLDYEEARKALGLADDAGFQLSVEPIDLDDVLKHHDFSHTKALYIGDWTSVASITLGIGQGTMVNANAQLNLTMAANTALERTVIDSIGVEFDNQVHITLGTPTILVQITTVPNVKLPLLPLLGLPLWDGDVLYDNKQYLDAVLPGKLATGGYDLLILGSGIDHSTLTANAVKNSVNTFVRNGGALMVFGSPGANFNWMQPIFDVSASSVSGAVSAPDPSHDALGSPWTLDWTHYATNNLGWTLGQPASFENILMQGGKPVIAISKPGTIGSGVVFLSSIQPRAVALSLGSTEAMHYMFNLLLYKESGGISDPSIVFGPDPPRGTPVSSSSRITVVHDGATQIAVRIELLAWSTD